MAWVEWIDPDHEELQEDVVDGDYEEQDDILEGENILAPGASPFDDILGSMSDVLDELCSVLQGLPVEDAEEEVRTTLQKATGVASDADTLAILLKVLRGARDAAMEGYDSWEIPVEYCRRLPELCDRNFVGALGGDGGERRGRDFPASVVAAVYAECGRTLALANELAAARERLQAAVNVFSVVPDSGSLELRQQRAGARASLARVWRRMGHAAAAREELLNALSLHAALPGSPELAALAGELCEVLGEAGADAVSPELVATIVELAVEKFDECSEEQLQVLRDLGGACRCAGRLALAAPALATRAGLLRSRCGGQVLLGGQGVGRGGLRSGAAALLREAEAAEEEAAQAFEASTAEDLQAGDLQAAAASWALALELRESALGERSPLVLEMRASLQALREAAASTGAAAAASRDAEPAHEGSGGQQEDGWDGPSAAEAPDCWDQEEEDEGGPAPEQQREQAEENPFAPAQQAPRVAVAAPPRARLSGAQGLRPSWAQKPAGEQRGKGVGPPPDATGGDAWDA